MSVLKLIILSSAVLLLAAPTFASSDSDSQRKANDSIWIGSYGNLSSWRAIGRDELIIWASPAKPYRVKIWRPFRSLRFAHTIGVTSTVGRVTKFDSVIIDGQRLPITSIEAIDKETAKTLRWSS